jgi:hypothetical protein
VARGGPETRDKDKDPGSQSNKIKEKTRK